MEAICPICKDYEGSPREVEAHISGMQDEAHKGRTGREFEKQITGQQDGNGGKNSRSAKTRGRVDLPNIECQNCRREVKYPELMPYKATCPECGRTIRKRAAFERVEEQADEDGKDELAEPKEV